MRVALKLRSLHFTHPVCRVAVILSKTQRSLELYSLSDMVINIIIKSGIFHASVDWIVVLGGTRDRSVMWMAPTNESCGNMKVPLTVAQMPCRGRATLDCGMTSFLPMGGFRGLSPHSPQPVRTSGVAPTGKWLWLCEIPVAIKIFNFSNSERGLVQNQFQWLRALQR